MRGLLTAFGEAPYLRRHHGEAPALIAGNTIVLKPASNTPWTAALIAEIFHEAGFPYAIGLGRDFGIAPEVLLVIAIVGAITLFLAATIAITATDIKRVLAYSTVSQLGYMMLSLGVGGWKAGLMHLITHAFFKSLLFMCSGSVIHAVHTNDMRKMGGLWKQIRFTWAMMLIGNLALTGVGLPYLGIGLAGFYSKDAIINSTFAAHTAVGSYAFTLLLVSAGMTSFYSWRQFLMTFHGRYRGLDHQHLGHSDAHAHDEPDAHDDAHGHHAPKLEEVHESPLVMLVPLAVLALGAVFAGMAFTHFFIGEGAGEFWRASLFVGKGEEGHLPVWVEMGPLVVTIIGFLIAYYYYILHPDLPRKLAAKRGMLYVFLYNKWYFDELYDLLFVRPAFWIGRFLWKKGDGMVIDGLGPDGVSARVLDAARGAVRLQSGYVYHYALAMLLGVVALATWFMASGGAL